MLGSNSKDFEVNRNDLDGEWIRQAGVYANYVDQCADALKKKNEAWLDKKVLKAQLFKEHRAALTALDGKPPSDTRVDNEVHADPRYEAVSRTLIDAEAEYERLDGLKWAMEHKKKALDHFSDDSDRKRTMPEGYTAAKREEAIDRKNEESVEQERVQREAQEKKAQATGRVGIRR
jgi:hypothetical protein